MRSCGIGYRAPYILDAISKVSSGEVDLNMISQLPDTELIQYLKCIHGVGKKVANCVALFSYGRSACVPVDVWISHAINGSMMIATEKIRSICMGIMPESFSSIFFITNRAASELTAL